MKKIINFSLVLVFTFSAISGVFAEESTQSTNTMENTVVETKSVENTSTQTTDEKKELIKKRNSERARRNKMRNLKKFRLEKTTSCLKEGSKRYDCRQNIEGYNSEHLVKYKDIATLEYKGGSESVIEDENEE